MNVRRLPQCCMVLPQLDIGSRTDVLDACPKAEGMVMLLRSMSPQVIITDEIGKTEDALAIYDAINAGVKVIASAHARDKYEIMKRPVLGELIREKAFERIVILSRKRGPGTIEEILDENLETVGSKEGLVSC